MNEELELLRNVQASYYESLKMKKEHQVSEKSDSGASETGLADYENFQMLNQTMQQEILQLRAYIDQQQNMIQVSIKFIFKWNRWISISLNHFFSQASSSSENLGQDQQLMASLLFERNRVTQLEKDLQNKDQALKSLMMDGEPGSSRRDSRESSRLRHDSASSEVGRILGSPDTDLMLQNERLQYDLDSSVGERRALSQQMQNWKRQLTQADQGSDVDSESEDFVRMKQEQAYRSVGALQLRVEELTLEVTKVSQLIIYRVKNKVPDKWI